ncbi:MAG: hypothetical protein KDI88_02815 [Gammaproteobacteria bacterium]|nr:hypothetical protein [Gammaproteobacteria bacterium]
MAKIKPTIITTPRIVQPRRHGALWLWLLFLVALSLWSWQVFRLGENSGGFDGAKRDSIEASLNQRIEDLEKQKMALTAQAARFERAAQIDREAAEQVKGEVRSLQEERATLKREVAFLKALVSGEASEELKLEAPKLVLVDGREYRFEVTLAKRAEGDDTVSGRVVIHVIGKSEGAEKKLDMEALTDGKRTNIGIRFRNFQKLKTDLKLPEGFDPSKIEVAVEPNGNVYKAFEQAYDWNVSDA